jgi:hypothetical protein
MAIRAVRYQYRGCEISVEVMNISWNKGFWECRAYVNYIKGGVARTESCFGQFNTYRSKEEAEQQVLEKAKLWFDSVLFER